TESGRRPGRLRAPPPSAHRGETAALRDGTVRGLLRRILQGGTVSADRGDAGDPRPRQRQPRRGGTPGDDPRPGSGGTRHGMEGGAAGRRGFTALSPATVAARAARVFGVVGN